ncbi:MAG TPA: tRNA (adenosine(37)-N6)-threonylcarbamoyltransferase complex ATPase subunit type 1 TsaE [Ktedonobacterales bacterium]
MRASPSFSSVSGDQSEYTVALRSASAECTRQLGVMLGALLQPGDMLLLTGDLGSGKTTLTQGIGAGVGVRGVVNSPTFTILKEYEGRLPFYHFDLYRLESPDEVYALGFDEYFQAGGVSVVEWAERGESDHLGEASPWPDTALRIVISADGPHARVLTLSATGERGIALAQAWARAVGEG